jgi:Holliday junction resolvasome RuvABC endonuclease subunit
VLGIDASTNSIAYCIFDNGSVIEYGEINFTGTSIYDRILDAKYKTKAIKERFNADFVIIEAAVMVRSAQTGLKMAYVFGTIMGELLDNGAKVVEVHPITWQSYIGNKNFTTAEKAQVKKDNPGRSDNWIKGKIREMRKQKTLDFVRELGVKTDSDNVADAAGIAWYAVKNLVK